MGGAGALAGYASGMASTLVGGALGSLDLQDANGIMLGDKVFDTKSINRFNSLVGSLAGQGVTYAMTGNASFNVLNASDLSGGKLQGGLLEMHVGDSGFSMNVGQGGADISGSMLASSFSGAMQAGKITSAKAAALFGDMRGVSTLDAANMMGYTDDNFDITMAKGLWDGKISAKYSDRLHVGSGDYGQYSQDDPSSITLSSDLLGVGKDKAALLASVMAHEGVHLSGNRYESVATTQGLRTYTTLLNSFNLKGDDAYAAYSLMKLADPRSWTENTGTTDDLSFNASLNRMYGEDGDSLELRVAAAYYAFTKGSQYVDLAGSGETIASYEEGYGKPEGMYTGIPKSPGNILDNAVASALFGIEQGKNTAEDAATIVGLGADAAARGDGKGAATMAVELALQNGENIAKLTEASPFASELNNALSTGSMAAYCGAATLRGSFRFTSDANYEAQQGRVPEQKPYTRGISTSDIQDALKNEAVTDRMKQDGYDPNKKSDVDRGVADHNVRTKQRRASGAVTDVTNKGINRPDLFISYALSGRTPTNYATEWDSAGSDRSVPHLLRIKSNDPAAVVILDPVGISIPGYVGEGGSTYHFSGSSFSTGTTFDTPKFLAYTVYNGFSVSNWMADVERQERTRISAASGQKY